MLTTEPLTETLSEVVGGPSLKRINLFEVYHLARMIRPACVAGPVVSTAIYADIQNAVGALKTLLEDDHPFKLEYSRSSAEELGWFLAFINREYFYFENREIRQASGAEAKEVDASTMADLRRKVENFEDQLEQELLRHLTYRAGASLMFDAAAMAERAHEALPADFEHLFGDRVLSDWRAAGRSFAFGLYTASGFHVVRALESVADRYNSFHRCRRQANASLGNFVGNLERRALDLRNEGTPSHDLDRNVQNLRDLNDTYRNKLAHPVLSLDQEQASEIYALGVSLMFAIAREIRAQ